MDYEDNLDEWVQRGLDNELSYMLIVQDLEDKEYFPVYFYFEFGVKRYTENIISESKLKVVKYLKLKDYSKSNA